MDDRAREFEDELTMGRERVLRRRRSWPLLGWIALATLLAPASRASGAACTTLICLGDPCTITGVNDLTPGCVLDFGTKAVTLGGSAILEAAPGSGFTVKAGTLTIRGTARAASGSVTLEASGNLTTVAGTLGRVIGNGDFGGVSLAAGGALTLNGTEVTANGDLGGIFLEGQSVTIDGSTVEANGGQLGGGSVVIAASAGDVVVASALRALGLSAGEDGGFISVTASGDITTSVPINVTGGPDASGGSIELHAGDDLTVGADLRLYGGGGEQGDGGELLLEAGGDLVLDGAVDARGIGAGASGGHVVLGSTGLAPITVNRPIDVGTLSFAGSSGAIEIGPACDVVIANALRANGSSGGGTIEVRYRRSLDLTGATLLADADAGNSIVCGCIDADQNSVCDGGCAADPVGLASATITPATTPIPDALGACSTCGNGVVEAAAGEQCDDGNSAPGDCCSAVCQYEANGSACAEDGNPCTQGACDGAGACAQIPTSGNSCDDGSVCTSFDACQGGTCVGTATPALGCTVPGAVHTSSLLVKRGASPKSNALAWKWKPGAVLLGDLGSPLVDTDYQLCVYGAPGGVPTLFLGATIPAGGDCGGKPCWKSKGSRGFAYNDRELTPSGIKTAVLGASTTGNGKLDVKGKGLLLPMPSLPLATGGAPVTVQLRAESGACWQATYSTPTSSTDRQFKAKAD